MQKLGLTTAMLKSVHHTLLQQEESDIEVWAHTQAYASQLRDRFCNVVNDPLIQRSGRNKVILGKTTITFRGALTATSQDKGRYALMFFDNSIDDTNTWKECSNLWSLTDHRNLLRMERSIKTSNKEDSDFSCGDK